MQRIAQGIAQGIRGAALLAGALVAACASVSSSSAPFAASSEPAWVQFAGRGTGFCVQLGDGTFRSVRYGVGGGSDFTLMRATVVPADYGIDCSEYGVVAVSRRGVVSSFREERGVSQLTAMSVEPHTRVRLTDSHYGRTCTLDEAGALHCGARGGPWTEGLAVRAFVDDDCVLTADRRVLCGLSQREPTEVFVDVDQASVSAVGYGACAVRGGRVFCRGPNDMAQRGFLGAVDAAQETQVPGLSGVSAVKVSAEHACAVRNGEVYCWGRADDGRSGEAARNAATKWPRCERDEAAERREQQALEEGRKRCSEPRPYTERHIDDPFCRGMSGAYASAHFKQRTDGMPCDPAGEISHSGPHRVDVDAVLALDVTSGMSCAVRTRNRIACWGGRSHGTKTLDVERAAPGAAPPDATAAEQSPPPVQLRMSELGVVVIAGDHRVVHRFKKNGSLGAAEALASTFEDRAVLDVVMPYPVCRLLEGGEVRCEEVPGVPYRAPYPSTSNAARGGEPTVFAVRFGDGRSDCVITDEAALLCTDQNGRYGAMLSAFGPITSVQSGCARYVDGSVRCIEPAFATEPRVAAPFGPRVRSFAIGNWGSWQNGSCAIDDVDGTVRCNGSVRAVPDEKAPNNPTLVPVALPAGFKPHDVVASLTYACVRGDGTDASGAVVCWGDPGAGQPALAMHGAPHRIADWTRVRALAASPYRLCALIDDDAGLTLQCVGAVLGEVQTAEGTNGVVLPLKLTRVPTLALPPPHDSLQSPSPP